MGARQGKYAHITATLPRLSNVDPERQDIVTAVKNEIMTTSPDDEQTVAINEANVYGDLSAMTGIFEAMLPRLKRLTSGGRRSADLAGAYELARVTLDDHIARWKSNVQVVVDAYEQLMLDQMEAEGTASIRLTSGAAVSTFLEPYSSIKDAEALRQWCLRDPDLSRKMSLQWSTVNALNKERLLAGEAPTPGVEVSSRPVVRLTKA